MRKGRIGETENGRNGELENGSLCLSVSRICAEIDRPTSSLGEGPDTLGHKCSQSNGETA
jgi:hypothetical protein